MFPCLNPRGLERNVRADAGGCDLNRCHYSRKVPQIAARLAALKVRGCDLAITLHEDYDARGSYLYEIASQRLHWGEFLSQALTPSIESDSRRSIDSSRAKNWRIRRRVKKEFSMANPKRSSCTFTLSNGHSPLRLPRRMSSCGELSFTKFMKLSINKLQSAAATRNVSK